MGSPAAQTYREAMKTTAIRRLLLLIVPLVLVATACGGTEEPAGSPTIAGGPAYLGARPLTADLSGCPATTSSTDLTTVFLVGDGCEIDGVPDGYLVVSPFGAFALSQQMAWTAMIQAFDAADASDAAAQLSLGWAAYQLRRGFDGALQVGWSADGTAWGFLLPTSGGEEDGVDVVTPYDARFEITFDEDGDADGVRFVEMCVLPGEWPGSTVTIEAPTCPAAS